MASAQSTRLVHEVAKSQAWLVVRSGCEPLGLKYDLRRRSTKIGRGGECSFTLNDESVSREHAKVIHHGHGRYSIIDLGSRNHTLLNDHLVDNALLQDGDTITIGRVKLVFKCVRPDDD